MYDILQLNDMLLPELLDIAEQQNITGAKKLDKQGLIYKILDSQAVTASETKDDPKKKNAPRARKPVTVKTTNGTEEAEVMQEAPAPVEKAAPRKGPVRKPRPETNNNQPEAENGQPTEPQEAATENGESAEGSQPGENNTTQETPAQAYPR